MCISLSTIIKLYLFMYLDAFESTSQYQPLAPNILVRGNDLITFESVSKLLEQLLTDDNSFDNVINTLLLFIIK